MERAIKIADKIWTLIWELFAVAAVTIFTLKFIFNFIS